MYICEHPNKRKVSQEKMHEEFLKHKVVIKLQSELTEGIKPEISGRSLPGEDLKLRFLDTDQYSR